MRGALPKPDSIKIAQGTLRKCRQKKNQPKSSGVPRSPFPAQSIAGKKWKEVTDGLKRLGLIDQIDATHIEGLCRCYQVAKAADAVIGAEGFVATSGNGSQVKHPMVAIASDAWHKVRMYSNDLGLNHLSRQRMESTVSEPGNDIESKFLA